MRSLFLGLSVCTVCLLVAGCGKKDDDGFEPISIDNYPTFANTSDDAVLLRYKLKTGQTLKMGIDLDIGMVIKQGGQTMNMKMPMVMEAVAAVTAVDAKGNMSIDLKITRMKVKLDMSGAQTAQVEFDSAEPGGNPNFEPVRAMVNVNLPCKISPTGQLLEGDMAPLMQAIDRAGNAALSKQMKDMLNQMVEGTFVQLSEKPVKAGETYKGGTLTMGGAKAHVSYKVHSVSGDKTQAVLEPQADFEFGPGAFQGADVTVKRQDFGGWMLFDLQKGFSTKGEGHISMLLEIKVGGETGTMSLKGKTVVTQTLQ